MKKHTPLYASIRFPSLIILNCRLFVKSETCAKTHIAFGKYEFSDGEIMGLKAICGIVFWELNLPDKRHFDITKNLPANTEICKTCKARA